MYPTSCEYFRYVGHQVVNAGLLPFPLSVFEST